MKLKKFRVTQFKSVTDSGWIECDDVTTLVGVNEAGKSNLILALWKLKPVQGGEIDILHDMPTSELSILRSKQESTPFIEAVITIDSEDLDRIQEECRCVVKGFDEFSVKRFYDGHYEFSYSDQACFMRELADDSEEDDEEPGASWEDVDCEEIEDVLVKCMPSYVYYSNYGNLSSRVYLPHAQRWLKGEVVPGVDLNRDQARTLKVLFDFVNLEPEEIIELGKDPGEIARRRYGANREPSKDEIEKAEKDKEERTILLNSAGTRLTKEFRDWWKQGEYVFRLHADGEYFTIWVSDDRRPTEVDLANRSTGLQWFLSFFLVFLVEANGTNANAVLLLDEAGLSLHPKAQRDLVAFFDGLARENQIIHTTHSPFLIDGDNIDRCVAVYMDDNGATIASNNLRDGGGAYQENAIYAVHAALGLSVSDVLLSGCYPVIVEGPSDQYALSAIKQRLIADGKITPSREIVFIPSGGNRGITAISGILGMKNDLPPVVLDGDNPGVSSTKQLRKGLYGEQQDRVLCLNNYLSINQPEIEDLMPYELVRRFIDRLFGAVEDEVFEDAYNPNAALVPQIEEFAKKHGVTLAQGKWKVDMAKAFKARLQAGAKVDEKYVNLWADLFNAVLGNAQAS